MVAEQNPRSVVERVLLMVVERVHGTLEEARLLQVNVKL
jgi:hypothetical protein